MTTTTIAVVSGKGGVGKTTLTANVAAGLGARGLQVLAVDLDGQGNLAQALSLPRSTISVTVADVLREDLEVDDVVLRSPVPGVSVLPATVDVFSIGEELRDRGNRHHVLRRRLERTRRTWDVVLLDSPPALGFHTVSALTAADVALIPTQLGGFALSGLNDSLDLISRVARDQNPDLRLLGLLPTFSATTSAAQGEMLRALHRLRGVPVFDTVIPQDDAFAESSLLGVPLVLHAPDSPGGEALREAVAELATRLDWAGLTLPEGRPAEPEPAAGATTEDAAETDQGRPRGILSRLFARE